MKNILIGFCCVFLMSCAAKVTTNEPPLGYTYMPKYINLDSVGGVVKFDTNSVVGKNYNDFKSIPIDSGKLVTIYKDTVTLRPGVLISERKAALYTYYKSTCESYQKQLSASESLSKSYYDNSVAAEKLYQAEIVRLKKEAQRSWLEQNLGYIGFLAGSAFTILLEYAILSTSNHAK